MKTRKLMATKAHKYGTRHLTAGEEYEAPPRHAVALVASRKAKFADKSPKNPAVKPVAAPRVAEPEPEPAVEPAVDMDRLRMEATQHGIDVDRRWGVARLQHEIAQVRG